MPRRLVLASTSSYRRRLLDAAGVAYEARAPSFVEDHEVALAPDAMAIAFARGKASSLRDAYPDALIVGSDQVPALGPRILTKPETRERAIEQLVALEGRMHHLHTAIALHDAREAVTTHRLVTHTMQMRPLTRREIEHYVDRDRPFDCAGSYRVEAAGALLFERMNGDDHTAIVGMPLTALCLLLAERGVLPFDLAPSVP